MHMFRKGKEGNGVYTRRSAVCVVVRENGSARVEGREEGGGD